MGEAIMTRAAGNVEPEITIPVVNGYHTALITVLSAAGKRLDNVHVNCRDGSRWYNYTTNENGQTIISTNSGAMNIYLLPYFKNNVKMLDQHSLNYYNLDAPVGQTSKHNIQLGGYNIGDTIEFNWVTDNFSTVPYWFQNNAKYEFVDNISLIDLEIGGGGGGGTSGSWNYSGAGGGGGEYNRINDIVVHQKTQYSGYLGSGGFGGTREDESWTNKYLVPGNTGGSTTFMGYSVYGGSGGTTNGGVNNSIGGIGGNNGYFGSGGNANNNGSNSNTIYGGGGGGGKVNNISYGGYPGGGNGGYNTNGTAYRASWGISGLGGGGGGGYGKGRVTNSEGGYIYYHNGGRGGAGLIRITIKAK